jgi:hypothetical protein
VTLEQATAWWSAEKQSRDVGGDLEAVEMPLKARMWRRGPAVGDASAGAGDGMPRRRDVEEGV